MDRPDAAQGAAAGATEEYLLISILSLLITAAYLAQATAPPGAQPTIVRLSPTRFPELPRDLAAELQRRGCTIPQVASFPKRQNVIHGEFAKPGQTDWAVLCSRYKVSTLLVFWNGSAANPSRLDRRDNGDVTRQISPVNRKYILDHYRAYGGPKPPRIDHQGIDDSFHEAASIIHYWYRGKWLQLTGAD